MSGLGKDSLCILNYLTLAIIEEFGKMLGKVRKSEMKDEVIIRKQFNLKIEIEEGNLKSVMVNKRIEDELRSSESNYIIQNDELTISKEFFSKKNHVPNVYRYVLRNEDTKLVLYHFNKNHDDFFESTFQDRRIDEENELPTITLILESPHEDEFKINDGKLTPVAPAQGATGDLIYAKLDILLNESKFSALFKDKEYRVLIVNPIPCQTSLVSLHKKSLSGVYKTLRDKIWVTLWENSSTYKRDFIKTLNEIKPKIILNCCTSNLSKYVSDEIPDSYEVIEIHHPSSWWRNNKYIKIALRDKK